MTTIYVKKRTFWALKNENDTKYMDAGELELVKDDDRGSIFQFVNRNSSKLLLVKRKKGTVSGCHYHTGKSKMKDPETVVLIDG